MWCAAKTGTNTLNDGRSKTVSCGGIKASWLFLMLVLARLFPNTMIQVYKQVDPFFPYNNPLLGTAHLAWDNATNIMSHIDSETSPKFRILSC